MSRAKRGRGPGAVKGARPPARGRSSRPPIVAILFAVALLATLGWWWAQRASAPRAIRPAPGAVIPVSLDSVAPAARLFEAATIRTDWDEALFWQRRIVAALPTNPLALRQLGQTLHNHRFTITLADGRPHWLLRNSLVRAEWEAEALRMFDSSGVVTSDPVERARAHYWKGRTADWEGLPLDALAEYEAALALVPIDTTLRRVRDQQRAKLVTP